MRIFDASVNDVVFAEDLDVYAAAGDCHTGYTITKTVPVDAQGAVELTFVSSSEEEAMISFIHIVPVSDPTTPNPTAAPTTFSTSAPTPSPTEKCWSSYTCPDNSTPNDDCPWGLWACDCEDGYERDWDNDSCIPTDPQQDTCWSTFTCPPENSIASAESNGCPWSIWDCICDEGFEPDADSQTCVEAVPKCWSTYTCPANSAPQPSTNGCPWSVWDCACSTGFVFESSTLSCVEEI